MGDVIDFKTGEPKQPQQIAVPVVTLASIRHSQPSGVVRKLYLREWRERQGMSATQMALVLGWGRDAIREYEVGRREPDLSRIEAMCKVLQISLEDIFRDPNAAA